MNWDTDIDTLMERVPGEIEMMEEDIVPEEEVRSVRKMSLDQLRDLIDAPLKGSVLKAEDREEWIDIGEHWNEIRGEMVPMEKHFKTGAFRVKEV